MAESELIHRTNIKPSLDDDITIPKTTSTTTLDDINQPTVPTHFIGTDSLQPTTPVSSSVPASEQLPEAVHPPSEITIQPQLECLQSQHHDEHHGDQHEKITPPPTTENEVSTSLSTSPPTKTITSPPQSASSPPVAQGLFQKIVIRSVVGILMMIFFYLVLQLQHQYITVFIILGQMIAWNEVVSLRYKLEKEKHLQLFRTINWYFLFVSFMFFYGKNVLQYLLKSNIPQLTTIAGFTYEYSRPIIFTLYVVGFVAFILSLRHDSLRYQFSQLTWTILTLLLVVGQTHFSMQYLYDGLVWILLPHGLIILNDIMAYFCGIFLGRKIINKPLFSLSPNKTWEGFIGAMFFTILFAFYGSPLFIQSDWLICPADRFDFATATCDVISFNHGSVFVPTKFRIPDFGILPVNHVTLYPLQIHAVIFALFASIIAPFGGFLASSIKRAYGQKDFHNLFPGHGGFMDRVDCQLLMCSFVFIYVTTFVKTDASAVESLIEQFKQLPKEQQIEFIRILNELVTPSF